MTQAQQRSLAVAVAVLGLTAICLVQLNVVIPAARTGDDRLATTTVEPGSSPDPSTGTAQGGGAPTPGVPMSGTPGGESPSWSPSDDGGSASPTPTPTVRLPTPIVTDKVPFTTLPLLGAVLDGRSVRVFGEVPDAPTRSLLLARAQEAVGVPVYDGLALSGGAGALGTDGFVAVLGALGTRSRAAAVSLRGGRLAVTGVVPDAGTIDQVRRAGLTAVTPQNLVARLSIDPSTETPGWRPDAAQVAAQVSTLPGVDFEIKSAVLSPTGAQIVQAAAELLRPHGTVRVSVQAHTDTSGKAASNLRLSQERAEAVGRALVAAGLPASRITTVGYGESHPLIDGTDDYADAMNRRVVLVATVG